VPHVVFAPALVRHVPCPRLDVPGDNVRTALEHAFHRCAPLRPYVLDDQGRLRRHVAVFVDAQLVLDRDRLNDATRPDSEIYVVQALSGG
jgi:sulfur-carrier protein